MTSWRPDWRKSAEYPRVASSIRWRWEFLRRNPAYQNVWDETGSRIETILRRSPELRDGIQSGDPATFVKANDDIERLSHIKEVLEPFGLVSALDPAKRYSDSHLELCFNLMNVGTPLDLSKGEVARLEKQGTITICFDVNRDIDAQIEWARDWLETERRNRSITSPQRRDRAEKWPMYLRVLDARECKATWKEIGTELKLLTAQQIEECVDPTAKAKQTGIAAEETMLRFSAPT